MQIEWKSCLKIGVTIFVLFLAIHYWEPLMTGAKLLLSAATPILAGFVAAYIINILMVFYEKRFFAKTQNRILQKIRIPACMLLAILSFILIITLIIGLVVPELTSCIQLLISDIPPAMEVLLSSELFMELAPEDLYAQLRGIDWKSIINEAVKMVSSGLGSTVGAVVSAVSMMVSNVVTGVVAFIFAIYFLLGKESLVSQCKRVMKNYMPEKLTKKIYYVTGVVNDSFHRYIVGQFTEAIILGVLCVAGMLVFQFPYAGMIGALIGFTALIPVAGAYIGGVVGFVMILTVSPVKALLFIVFLLVLQQLEGNLIYPKVVGGSLGLPAIWVLAAVTIGGALLGIMGMLIGVPIAAAIYRLIRDDMRRKEQEQQMQEEQENVIDEYGELARDVAERR
ncbi:MAG: AI-2E family transporter [Roseburia sp.]|nr:AI-2E family transporter [Roseburia sp.]